MKRKEFLRYSASAAVGAAWFPRLSGARAGLIPEAAWPAPDASEEAYWDFVRGQFPLTQERAYLNTGGLGASPKRRADFPRCRTSRKADSAQPPQDYPRR